MKQEVKRSGWSKFCKRFSAQNQYRPMKITLRGTEVRELELGHDFPFLGVVLQKKGRFIDGIQFLCGRGDVENLIEKVVSVKQPTKMILEKDSSGITCRLRVQSRDGTALDISICGNKELDQQHKLVEKVAYDLHERRGHVTGDDWNNWLEAERIVKKAELQLTR